MTDSPDTPQEPRLSPLDRIAQRRMQDNGAPAQGNEGQPNDPEKASHVLRNIIRAEGRVGYAAKLKHRIAGTGRPIGGGSGGDQAPNEEAGILRELLAAKIAKQTGLRPQLEPEEIMRRLRNDGFIVGDGVTMAGISARYKTTGKALGHGVYGLIKGMNLQSAFTSNNALISFSEDDFISKLRKHPNTFLSVYQNSVSLDASEVLNRLEKLRILSPVETEKNEGKERSVHYVKTQGMINLLNELIIPMDLIKGQGAKVAYKALFDELKANPKAFDSLLVDPVKLTPAEVIQGLVERDLIWSVKPKNLPRELRVKEAAVYPLTAIGVVVENRPGGGLAIQTSSLDNALGNDVAARNAALEKAKLLDYKGGVSR